MPAVKVRDAIAYVEERGWTMLRRGKGDHRIYGHPASTARIVIPGGLSDDLKSGTWRSIKRLAEAPFDSGRPQP